jgi:nucleotide-binding universal stress UspA family protein
MEIKAPLRCLAEDFQTTSETGPDMKTILVLTGGSSSDASVFETALAAAQPFAAHLRFVHIRIGSGQAAMHSPHVDFARGPALADALSQLESDAERRSTAFGDHVRAFCTRFNVAMRNAPGAGNGVTASLLEESDDAARRLVGHARHYDLVVMGRSSRPNGLPPDFIETLLLRCGRPILLAAPQAPRNLAGTIMVCWRETPDAARALGAAMPFLTRAQRVVFVGVHEKGDQVDAAFKDLEALNDVAAQFRWCGVPTYVRAVPGGGRPIADVLASAAAECAADLVVMGAYGHSHMREVMFGGCTQAVIGHAERPVLMLH